MLFCTRCGLLKVIEQSAKTLGSSWVRHKLAQNTTTHHRHGLDVPDYVEIMHVSCMYVCMSVCAMPYQSSGLVASGSAILPKETIQCDHFHQTGMLPTKLHVCVYVCPCVCMHACVCTCTCVCVCVCMCSVTLLTSLFHPSPLVCCLQGRLSPCQGSQEGCAQTHTEWVAVGTVWCA